jgi:hypothetical protein
MLYPNSSLTPRTSPFVITVSPMDWKPENVAPAFWAAWRASDVTGSSRLRMLSKDSRDRWAVFMAWTLA